MSHSTTERPRAEFVSRSVRSGKHPAFTAGAGMCMAFALGFWVRGLIDDEVGRSARAGPESAAGGPPATAHLDHPQAVKTERAEPKRLGETQVPTPIVAAPPTTPRAEAAPLAVASTKPPPDRPLGPVRDQTPAPAVRDDRRAGSRCTATICVASGGWSGVVALCSAGEAVICPGRFEA